MSTSIIASILAAGTNSYLTTSAQMNGVPTDFISPGVVGTIGLNSGSGGNGSFAVNAQGTPAMFVDVTAGVAWITATPTGQVSQKLRAYMASNYTSYAISANSSGSTKYDWIYLKVDPDNAATPASDGSNVVSLYTSRSSSNTTDNGTPPTYGILLAIVTVANGASSITNSNILDSRYVASVSGSASGWTSANETWTYSAWDSTNATATITVPSDATTKYTVGMRVKFTNNGSVQYGIITSVASTSLKVYMGTDYSLSNSSITSNYYSLQKAPFGFPLSPTKWTVSLTDSSDRSQSSPVSGTWYNLGSLSFSLPIGAWSVSYKVQSVVTTGSASTSVYASMSVTLSTSSSSETVGEFTTFNHRNNTTESDGSLTCGPVVQVVSTATTYYLIAKSSIANVSLIRFGGASWGTTFVRAVCAYL